jgi:glycosyltransferase involved in cell wall biosynthesis
MRIALITSEYITESNFDGGLANYLHRTAHALLQLGHEPIVIVGTDKDEKFEQNGVTVLRVDVHNRLINFLSLIIRSGFAGVLKRLWQSWKLNQKLQEIHQENKIDLAQFASYMATAFFCRQNIPSIVRISSLQSLWDEAYEYPKSLTRGLANYLELKSFKKSDMLICPSHKLADAIEHLNSRKVYVIESPYLPPSEEFDMQKGHDLLEGKKYLLFFGTIGLLKGVKTIAAILQPLLERYPDLLFAFAGKNMPYQGKTMMDYVWRHSGFCRDRVLYLGRLPHQELYPVIKNSQAVILPSRVDNFPNTCIEAMAQGRIVIGTQGASFEQLIEDGKSGFLCKIDDSPSLLTAIEKALALSYSKKLEMGEKAKDRIKGLSPDIVVQNLLNVYQEVIYR